MGPTQDLRNEVNQEEAHMHYSINRDYLQKGIHVTSISEIPEARWKSKDIPAMERPASIQRLATCEEIGSGTIDRCKHFRN